MLWKAAKKRVGFRRHLAAYAVINTLFWALWYIMDFKSRESSGIPWPLFPMMGWGLVLFLHFLGAFVFVSRYASVEKEYEKLKNKS